MAAIATAVVLVVLWALFFRRMYVTSGLFRAVGTDFALYYIQAEELRNRGPGAIYNAAVLDEHLRVLATHTVPPNSPLIPFATNYSPLFIWLFIPFTWAGPKVGFFLWTGISLLAVAYLVWRIRQHEPAARPIPLVLAVLAAFPVAMALYWGQVELLLAVAVAEWYYALQAKREFRAGLWLACLLLKPQYGILIGPILLWKQRWRVVAGVAAGGALVFGGALLLGGLSTLQSYAGVLLSQADFQGSARTSVFAMVNWRGLVHGLPAMYGWPELGDRAGLLLAAVLGLATVLPALTLWRGRWRPERADFPARVVALLIATLLATYYSHTYAPALLIAPAAALFFRRTTCAPTRHALVGLVLVPSAVALSTFPGLSFGLGVRVLQACLVLTFLAILRDVWVRSRPVADRDGTIPAGQPLAPAHQ